MIENIIKRLSFREATTMKNIPHEYTVKNSQEKEAYETLFRYIKKNCYIKTFYGKPYKYCDIGEFTYWIMSDDISVSKIINRTRRKEA